MVPKLRDKSHLGQRGLLATLPVLLPLLEHLGLEPGLCDFDKHPGDSAAGSQPVGPEPWKLGLHGMAARRRLGSGGLLWVWQLLRAQDFSFDPYQFHTPLCHQVSEGAHLLPGIPTSSICAPTDKQRLS